MRSRPCSRICCPPCSIHGCGPRGHERDRRRHRSPGAASRHRISRASAGTRPAARPPHRGPAIWHFGSCARCSRRDHAARPLRGRSAGDAVAAVGGPLVRHRSARKRHLSRVIVGARDILIVAPLRHSSARCSGPPSGSASDISGGCSTMSSAGSSRRCRRFRWSSSH